MCVVCCVVVMLHFHHVSMFYIVHVSNVLPHACVGFLPVMLFLMYVVDHVYVVIMYVMCQDSSGMTLSILAAAGGQDDILRLLIRKGVRVNGRQKNGTTALMHAAEKVT